ncbi:hypothetical protein BKA67DRAFT_664795 [Truncatella angustata]|uniref:Uncharacterized protein n=1 Tax=Truncatella angustata TaxID=152316 RepID=A0A9P8RIW3_9PEZI|nr:uncharacterized protein BKA67DRAFT_664795 [Truncatella angustata]KAH6644941.1 hypothetical protein BKA67DRAFT_664795 [Truncatella angustata]
MAERSPDLSPWEDVESSSDEEQLFNLDNNLTTNEYDSDDSWIAIKLHRMHPPMQASSRSLALHQPQHCSHLAERRCAINVSGQCCECSDKRSRTESGLYSTYVDGRGWVEKATRWAYYCPGCKDYHETAVLNQVMERLQRRAAQHEEAQQQFAISQCEHWLERECSITNTGKCCACSDLRPGTSSQLYPAYVDGKGWVADVSRWAHYW